MSQGTPIIPKRFSALEILSEPVDATIGDQLIRNFHAAVDTMPPAGIAKLFPNDRTCSIEFEGNDLLAMLAQDGARNIRFYFALHMKDYTSKKKNGTQGQIKPHLTLVAVAVDGQGNEMRPAGTTVPPDQGDRVPIGVHQARTGSGILYEFGFPCPPDC